MTRCEYEPYSASATFTPVTGRAVEVFEGDIETLKRAGGKIVGYLDVSGNGFSSFRTTASRAARDAALHGATHFVVLGKDVDTSYATTPGYTTSKTTGSASAYAYGNYAHAYGQSTTNTVYTPPQTYQINKPRARYAIIRVDPSRWTSLPEPIRPQPIPSKPATK
jgi:hypothetical protein